jgi:tetratricopeptide (TPR) repeat protein
MRRSNASPNRGGAQASQATRYPLALYLAVAVVLALYGAARIFVAKADLPVTDTPALDNPMVAVDGLRARLTAFAVIARVLRLWSGRAGSAPTTRAARSPQSAGRRRSPTSPPWLSCWAVVAAFVVWAFRQRRLHPERSYFATLAVLAWLPASNLILIIGTPLAERTLYLPFAGMSALIACVLDDVRGRATRQRAVAVSAAVAAVLAACALRTWFRNEDWRGDRSLWTSAIAAVPGSAKAHAALAATLFVEDGSRGDIDHIIALGERAIAIEPSYQNALVALGGHYVVKGDRFAAASSPAEARSWYLRAIDVLERARGLDDASTARFRARMAERGSVGPDRADANLYNNLSLAYARAGRYPDALVAYQRSRDLDPLNANRQGDVGAMLAYLERWDEAAVALWSASLLAPGNDDWKLQLVEVYRHLPAEGPRATIESGTQVQIALDHPAVRRQRCRAMEEIVAHLAAAGRSVDAAALRAQHDADCRLP